MKKLLLVLGFCVPLLALMAAAPGGVSTDLSSGDPTTVRDRCDVEAKFYSFAKDGMGRPAAGLRGTICSNAYKGKWEFEYKYEDANGPMHEGTHKKNGEFNPSQIHHTITLDDAPAGWTKCLAVYWVGCYPTAEDFAAGTFEEDDKDPPPPGWKTCTN